MNLGGRIFGMKRFRAGVDNPSASASNQSAGFLEQLGNITFLPPLFWRKNGTGIFVGVTQTTSSEVAYPCRVVEPLLNNEPLTAAQLEAWHEPARITYRLAPDPNAKGRIPAGVDFAVPMAVRYGRPFEPNVKIKVARAGSLCFVSASIADPPVAELFILDEKVGTRSCTPTAPGDAGAGGGASFSQSNSFLQSPEPQAAAAPMPTSSTSSSFTLDAARDQDFSEPFYVGDADYVALSGLIQDGAIKAGWTREMTVFGSPDNRVWRKVPMVDLAAGTKADAVLDADGFITIDCREAILWVRAQWQAGGTPLGSSTLVDMLWSKKAGTR